MATFWLVRFYAPADNKYDSCLAEIPVGTSAIIIVPFDGLRQSH